MRSFVVEPMQYGAFFWLAMLRTSYRNWSKGMNLAIADVRFFLARSRRSIKMDGKIYCCLLGNLPSEAVEGAALLMGMTAMLHRWDSQNEFDHRRQLCRTDYLTSSRAA